jgi:hypothetical protein
MRTQRRKPVKKQKTYRQKRNIGGAESSDIFVFRSNQVSMQANTDPSFKEIGILHITESEAVNSARAAATDFLNVFGNKGFNNTIYDKTRNTALTKLMQHVAPNQKIFNLRFDTEMDGKSQLFFIHLYGSLFEKTVHIQVNPQTNV